MDLKQGPVSFVQLVKSGFSAANKAFDSALITALLLVLLNILILLIGAGAPFLLGSKALWLQVPLALLQVWTILLFVAATTLILATKLEKHGITASDAIRNAVLPAVYTTVAVLFVALPVTLFSVSALLTRSLAIQSFIFVTLPLILLPFLFTMHVTTLRGEAPIAALRYSWSLGTKHYIRILFTIIAIGAIFTVLGLAIVCLFHWTGITNPFLHWSKHLSGILVFLVCLIISLYVGLSIQAIFTALFLNLDYCNRLTQNREADIQLPSLETEEIETSQETASVGLTQTSVHTHSDEDTLRNLEQVYNAQEHLHLGKAQEEDRMPTILFDDEMARQLSKTNTKAQQPAKKTDAPADDA